jgi:hypothetical protein
MKRFICVALLVAMFIVATTGLVSASSVSVTVTANPKIYVTTGLAATYISDYEVGLTWLMGSNVTNVMIRAEWGSTPTARNDGFLVYYGNATNFVHYTSLATATQPVYYRLWSQMPDGSWDDVIAPTAGGDFMSKTMVFIVVAVLALGLSLGYTWKRQGFFAYAATAFWLFLGLLSMQTSSGANPLDISDVYMGLFWVCMGMVITFALLPTLSREKREVEDIKEDWEGEDLSTLGFGKEEGTKVQPRKLRSRFGETGVM